MRSLNGYPFFGNILLIKPDYLLAFHQSLTLLNSKKFQFDILFWIAVASICVIVCNDFIFNNTIELFSGGAKLGTILENLSLAYISSYIFYIVIFIYKERRDKRNVYKSVYQDSAQLVGRA